MIYDVSRGQLRGGSVLILLDVIGRAVVILAAAVILLMMFALFSCVIVLRYNRALFPDFSLFVLNIFHEPVKRLFALIGYDSEIVDRVSVELANKANMRDFMSVPVSERMLILPQCLRSVHCPAKLDAENGIICAGCGRCDIAKIIAICRKLHIEVYISPGGTFTKRIIMRRKKAVVGVACYPNLYEGAMYVKIAGIPAQGVPLKSAGCVGTHVECDEILKLLVMRR
ncbi:MAG: DUF116 domain-containing protein [Canidatus Methanoxibalbensis ujae]|nr:DUF116 domain-containing protein [Candidatus Methanoxibalbensis ujae]